MIPRAFPLRAILTEMPAERSSVSHRFPEPFIKWAGGKSQLLDRLLPLTPKKFNVYFEPFVGGGAMFFRLRPPKAVISDANWELVNAYKVIKNDLDSLLAELEKIKRRKLTSSLYEEYRRLKVKPVDVPDPKLAARFIFLNKTCYNGLYRVNKNEEFNVPFGKYRVMPKLYEEENLKQINRILQTTQIMLADFETAVRIAQPGDFVYFDPPYTPDPQSMGFTNYTKDAFPAGEQERLSEVFKRLDRRGCMQMMSNADTRLTRRLYSEYSRKTCRLSVDRVISCIGTKRTGFREVVVVNYGPPIQTLAPWLSH
jgi:DNA adenine methylase